MALAGAALGMYAAVHHADVDREYARALTAMSSSSQLLIELGGVITALGLLTALSARIRISPIPGYLLAGLGFGKGGILPLATSEEFISTGAEIGVVLLLFTLGLEYTARERCLWVPITSSTSCHQAVFVDHATDLSLFSDAVQVEVDRLG